MPEIKFSGIDNVTPELRKMGPAMQTLLKQAFSEGEKFTNNAKDLLKYAKERLAITQQIKAASIEEKIKGAPDELKKQLEELKKQKEEFKKLAAQSTPGSKEKSEYEGKYKSIKREEAALPGKMEEQVKNWQEELKENKSQSQLLKLIWMSLEMNAKRELFADEKNSKELVEKFKNGSYQPESPEEKIKLLTQQGIVEQQKKESDLKPSFWKDVKKIATGMIIGEGAVGFLKSAAEVPGKAVKGIMGIQSGEEAPVAVLKSLENLMVGGAVAGVAGDALKRHIEEKAKADTASFKVKGTMGYGGAFATPGYGMDVESMGTIIESYIKARGTGGAGKGYGIEATNMLQLMKGLNLSQETLTGNVKLSRYSAGSDQEIMSNTVRLIGLMRASGGLSKVNGIYDNTKVEEWIQALTDLGTSQLQTLEKIDQAENSRVLASFSTIWNDPKQAAERIKSVNTALSTPSTDYQKAMNFAVLASKNKGASLFTLLEEQEKGVASKGLLTGRLDMLKKMYGSGDMFKLATMNAFGLSAEQTNKMTAGYLLNPKTFDSSQYLDSGRFKIGELEANTSKMEQQQAEISAKYVEGPLKGLAVTLNQAIVELGKSLTESMNELRILLKSKGIGF